MTDKPYTMPNNVGTFRQVITINGMDITNYVLGGQISRSIAKPTGSWTLHLRPVLDQNDGMNTYIQTLPINLNDYVEIRLDRTNRMGYDESGPVRIAMRGFLDNEEFQEQPSQGLDGSPQRQYMLSGSDLGKLLERRQIFIPQGLSQVDITKFLSAKTEFLRYSSWAGAELGQNWNQENSKNDWLRPLSTWVAYFLAVTYKTQLESMINSSDTYYNNPSTGTKFEFNFDENLPKIDSADREHKLYVTFQPMLNNTKTSSFWEFIQLYCPKPFIETFFTETNKSTTFHLRWSPLRSRRLINESDIGPNVSPEFEYFYPSQYANNKPWFDINKIRQRDISTKEILLKQLRRQELDRCTYFFCMMHDKDMGSTATGGVKTNDKIDQNVRGSNPYYDVAALHQFGYRPFTANIPWWPKAYLQIPRNPTSNASGNAAASVMTEQQRAGVDLFESLRDFNTWLVDTLAFTDRLYFGSITILGNTDVQLGEELYVVDTGERFYIESIEHTWSVFPAPNFLTRLGVTRGQLRRGVESGMDRFPSTLQYTETLSDDGTSTRSVRDVVRPDIAAVSFA